MLRDIRQLTNIEGEIKKSLHPATPLFYRVDLLKVAITDYMLELPQAAKYFVFSDVDIKPMTSGQLFDQQTLHYLSDHGYVFNGVGCTPLRFENSFFIFNKEKENLRRIHRKSMIDDVAAQIARFRIPPKRRPQNEDDYIGAEFIYDQYVLSFFKKVAEVNCLKKENLPRKIVECPTSQFQTSWNFSNADHQREMFRFIGNDNIPYTVYGRAYEKNDLKEEQIQQLKEWQSIPLSKPRLDPSILTYLQSIARRLTPV